jgi:Acetoacetate decarboxylase (ADC)
LCDGYVQIAQRWRIHLAGSGGYAIAVCQRPAQHRLSDVARGSQNNYAHNLRPPGENLMTPPNPFAAINLNGDGTMRGVTLALPNDRVRDFLPAGIDLGKQNVTPAGTHPVILFFHDMFRAQISIPTLLPNMTYHEHSMGVPFSYITNSAIAPGIPGPYYFMPKLYLDNFWATLGGLVFWGFAKEMASVSVTAERYTVTSMTGQRLTSLAWKADEGVGHRPIAEYPHFEPVRQMLSQPIISMVPLAMGPFFILSDFDKAWDVATVRPLHTALEVDVEYVPGYAGGRYPMSDWSPGIDSSVLGSYELRAPWRLSLPYPPLLSFRR